MATTMAMASMVSITVMVNVMDTAMGMVKKRRSRYLAIYTIKDYDKEFQLYRLAFPNDEVRYGFFNFLVPYYTR
jgi:hypothetical protein